ncbi:hydroxymethylbilane synthase [bacterium]|nr:hydroxymethylbilane synthase [bacterium]
MHKVRIGTRGSPLALWQAHFVRDTLASHFPDQEIDLVILDTKGDQIRDRALSQIGSDGLFTKEIQLALLDKSVDIAVHSLKDLPTAKVQGLRLAAIPKRGSTGDAFVSNTIESFDALPKNATVGTTSLRRRSQAMHRRPDLNLVHLRGNVETRLNKIETEKLDGIILAEAGLIRLGFENRIKEILDPEWMLPAVGQGALGLECREDDSKTLQLLSKLDDPQTNAETTAERSLLRNLGGGCLVPVGIRTKTVCEIISLTAVVLSEDGKQRIISEESGPLGEAEEIGQRLAEKMKKGGAEKILAGIRPAKPS